MRNSARAIVPEPVRGAVARWMYNSSRRWIAPWYAATDPRFRTRRRRLESMKGEFSGERCVVMGNGPSLNEMDLARFASERVWASNRAYLLFERIEWRPRFWVAVDRRVVPDIAAELMGVQASLPETRFFYPDEFLLDGSLSSLENTYWFREIREPDNATRFTLSPPDYVSSVGTVTITALQLAVHLGFNPIYLIGCDTSYTVPTTAKHEGGDANRLVSTVDDDPNHFDPSYFGAGRRWHEPHVDRMVEHYEKALEATRASGVDVINATVGGNLEVFPRVDYEDVFSARG